MPGSSDTPTAQGHQGQGSGLSGQRTLRPLTPPGWEQPLTSPYASTAGFQRCFKPKPSQSYTISTISIFLPSWDGGQRGQAGG